MPSNINIIPIEEKGYTPGLSATASFACLDVTTATSAASGMSLFGSALEELAVSWRAIDHQISTSGGQPAVFSGYQGNFSIESSQAEWLEAAIQELDELQQIPEDDEDKPSKVAVRHARAFLNRLASYPLPTPSIDAYNGDVELFFSRPKVKAGFLVTAERSGEGVIYISNKGKNKRTRYNDCDEMIVPEDGFFLREVLRFLYQ